MNIGNGPRLVNQLLENPEFKVDRKSVPHIARDIINMNWWNTCEVLLGYQNNRRVSGPFSETQKLIAVQLKEFYRARRIAIKDDGKLRAELAGYINSKVSNLPQLGAYSMLTRANPSQYFDRQDGTMTWVDCTSRATYAAKYVYQNGYGDFDGRLRVLGATKILDYIRDGLCENLGVTEYFIEGDNSVKAEMFSQKTNQYSIAEWVQLLGIKVIPGRTWLFDAIKHIKTDPYKIHEAAVIKSGTALGVNEGLYGLHTSQSVLGARSQSREGRASHASNASSASDASHASAASHVSCASDAAYVSRASHASGAASASDAGTTGFSGQSWDGCETAIKRPAHLVYPKVFRKTIFGIAGNWKIDKGMVAVSRLGWFDPFSGHGTSPLYAKRMGIRYLGFDTNKKAFDEYLNTINEVCAESPGPSSEVRCFDSTVFDPSLVGQFDLCYTSPPYFNFEEYGGNTGHYDECKSYGEFHTKITLPVFTNVFKYLIPGGTLALQSEKEVSKRRAWEYVLSRVGFKLVSSGVTGTEALKYSKMARRDQSLLVFTRPEVPKMLQ